MPSSHSIRPAGRDGSTSIRACAYDVRVPTPTSVAKSPVMRLSYVFWHCPRAGVDREEYEETLRAFHRRLADIDPPGFGGSWTVRLTEVPWLNDQPGYEDRYLVADFAALGALNDAAARPAEHAAAARMSGHGIAGVYRLIRGTADPAATAATWLGKPDGVSYPEFLDRLDIGGSALWQRQMTLGPTPEFQIIGAGTMTLAPL